MIEKILYSRKDIERRVKELAVEISKDYEDKDLVVVSLLRGAFIFAADLIREITVPVCIDFMITSSYEDREVSNGEVNILGDVREDIKDKDVLIVDDIIDSGHTLKYIYQHLATKNPRSLKTCVFLDKASRRQTDINADYVGHEIDDVFIVGYGLNYKSHYRNIPNIFTWES